MSENGIGELAVIMNNGDDMAVPKIDQTSNGYGPRWLVDHTVESRAFGWNSHLAAMYKSMAESR